MSSDWMVCTTCRGTVQMNSTGICLGCQGGFKGPQKEDRYLPIETKIGSKEDKIKRFKEREKELEDAIQKSETKSVHVCEQTRVSKGVRSKNAKRKETSKESNKTKKEEMI